ncbi:hypothetical protein [Pseudoroseomonas sp. WGS1072]|uniref:hypothetical protein n=1 Tax=Roseomonas sp. WGS1072 TaxID=3366816 RepID=UPI003BF29C71
MAERAHTPDALSASSRRRAVLRPWAAAYLLEKRRLQDEIEHLLDQVELLLAQADALDGDPDLEPDADGEAEADEASLQPAQHPAVNDVIRLPGPRRARANFSEPAPLEAGR